MFLKLRARFNVVILAWIYRHGCRFCYCLLLCYVSEALISNTSDYTVQRYISILLHNISTILISFCTTEPLAFYWTSRENSLNPTELSCIVN